MLKALGLTKEAIARLLGLSTTVEVPAAQDAIKKRKRKKLGRPVNHFIPQETVEAVKNAPAHWSNRELAKRYGVSEVWVHCVKKGKLRRKG